MSTSMISPDMVRRIRLGKSAPDISSVHIATPLANVAVAYQQNAADMVAFNAFPVVPVMKPNDKFFVFPKGQWFRNLASKRTLGGGRSAGAGFPVTYDDYSTDIWAMHHDTPNPILAAQDQPINLEMRSAKFTMSAIMLAAEIEWASKYMTVGDGTWTTELTGDTSAGSGKVKYWDADGSDPVDDILKAREVMKELTGYYPNGIVMGPKVKRALMSNAAIKDRLKYNVGGGVLTPRITMDALASLFEVQKLLVGSATQNTAAQDVTPSMSFVLGNSALLYYAPEGPAIDAPSAGYTFVWNGLPGSVAGVQTRRWEDLDDDVVRIETQIAFAQKKVAADLGVRFGNVLSG